MDHFAETSGHYKCPMCGGQSGGVEPKVYMAPEPESMNGISGGDGMPLVALSCDNCGHVSFFSVKVLGVV